MKTFRFASLILAFALVFSAQSVLADSAAIDFESPTYSTGTVHLQDGWSSSGAAGSGCAVYDHAVVSNTYGYVSFGGQSLRISNAVTSGCFSDQTFSKSLTDEAGESTLSDAYNGGYSGGTRQPYFEAQWDFASTVPGSEQAGLSVVASPDRGDGARMSWIQMADTPTGLEVNFYDYQISANPPTGDFVFTNVASGLDRTVPHTIKVTMQFVDGPENDIVEVYVDGNLMHTGTSWEDYFRQNQPPGTRTVDSILFRTGGTAAPATAGYGFLIDNLSLYSGPVPVTQCTSVCYVDDAAGNDANGGTSLVDAKKTIQAAINQVDVGGTVYVNDGTYNESPNITKSLSLSSINGRDVTTINLQTGPTYLGGLTIDAPTVTVDGFTITGFDAVGSGLASSNIVVTTSPDDVLIANNRIKVGQIGIGSNGDDGIGLITYYDTSGDVNNLTVTDNIFVPLNTDAFRAFYVNPGVDKFTFSQNEVTGNFTGRAITQAKDGLVEENTITGVGAPGSRSRGIGTWGYPDPTVYGRTTFRNNTITGTNIAIAIYETENVTVENNFFSDNGVAVWTGPAVPLAYDATTIHINGNSILNSDTYGVERDASLSDLLDASANWWGVNTPAGVAAEVSAGVDYTPWLNSGTDTSASPGFQGDFSYLHVDDDSPQTGTVGRVQEGVDLVTASTVHVVAGTYVEQVTITASMTIFGDSAASTFIVAPVTIPVSSDPNSTIVKIAGTGVSVDFSRFTVTGPGPSGCGSINTGIFVRDDAYANIHDNHILDIRDNPFSGCQNGVAIQVGRAALSTSGTADITDNVISGYQKNGVTVSNLGSSATIDGNTITGAGPTTIIAQNGVQISGGATAEINNNAIANHSYSPGSYTSTGMLIYGSDADTYGNTLSENQSAIYHIEGSGVHEANILTVTTAGTGSPYLYGFVIDAPPPGLNPAPFEDAFSSLNAPTSTFSILSPPTVQDIDLLNNELTGDGTSASYGIGAYAGYGSMDIDLTVKNNKVINFGTGLDIFQCTGGGCSTSVFTNVVVNLNSITGNTDYGLLNTDAIPVNAELNWWNSASGPAPTGSGDEASGDVDYTPWLCSGTDTSPNTGFQPIVNTDCDGPVITTAYTFPPWVYLNGWIWIKAVADDTTTGNADIASAEYNLNNTGWLPMTTWDAAFDEPNEFVKAYFKATTIGANEVCVRATDAWGNVGDPKCVTFTVKYRFSGFYHPVNMGHWVNLAKAGKTIPVKFRLTDAYGHPISNPASFVGLVETNVNCTTFNHKPTDWIEFYSTGTGLQYLGNGYWQYNWQIPNGYLNTCRTIRIQFNDGTMTPEAKFKFK